MYRLGVTHPANLCVICISLKYIHTGLALRVFPPLVVWVVHFYRASSGKSCYRARWCDTVV